MNDKLVGDFAMKAVNRRGVRRYKRSESIVFRKTKEAFGGLSNMAAGYPITLGNLRIATSENLYQALRYPNFPDIQREILLINNPMKAKMYSRKYYYLTRRDWNAIRIPVMRLVLQIKLINNWDKFRTLLLNTKSLPIVEESYKDTFWGARPIDQEVLEGVNALGRLLMELRDNLNKSNKHMLYNIISNNHLISNLILLDQPISIYIHQIESNFNRVKNMLQVPLFEAEATLMQHVGDFAKSLKSYSNYLDSNVSWLGKVPEGWGVHRLKSVALITMGQSPTSGKYLTEPQALPFLQGCTEFGDIHPIPKQFHTSPTKIAKSQSILLSVRAPVGRLNWADREYGIGRGLAALTPHTNKIHPSYLWYYLESIGSKELQIMSTGSTYDAVSSGDVGNITVFLPPLPEQRAIVRFLDWADRRIKFIIAARKRRIQLLEEYRQVLINDAVTGKFDVRTGKPYPAYKDSGVEWLGNVPEGWEVVRLKRVARLAYGDSLPADTRSGGHVPVFGSNGPVGYHNQANTLGPVIIVGRKGSFGKVQYSTKPVFAIDTTFYIDKRYANTDLRWLYYLLTRLDLDSNSKDSAVPGLDREDAYARLVFLPPLPEQRAIAEYLDRETAKIDEAIEKTKKSIELWEELRTTLIADVVTGKYDVRELAEGLPEEEPELEAKIEILEASLQAGEIEADEGFAEEEIEAAEETA